MTLKTLRLLAVTIIYFPKFFYPSQQIPCLPAAVDEILFPSVSVNFPILSTLGFSRAICWKYHSQTCHCVLKVAHGSKEQRVYKETSACYSESRSRKSWFQNGMTFKFHEGGPVPAEFTSVTSALGIISGTPYALTKCFQGKIIE